jgi:hypothetical protein
VAVLVTSLVLITRAGSDKGGASSPDDAAAAMFSALENEDLVAMAELMHPGERRTLAEPTFEIVDELIRLELIDPSIDLSAISGIDIAFEGLQYRVAPIEGAADLYEVLIDAGTISITANGAALPVGATIREQFGSELDEINESETDPMEGADPGPVMVEYDGQWYFSLWYSVAEAARRDSGGQPVPALADMPVTLGADSPEAAVDGMIAAMTDLDLTAAIGMIDPEEGAALYRYAPLFLDDANQAVDDVLADLDASDVTWSVDNIRYDTSVDGDTARVRVVAFDVNVQAADVSVLVKYSPNELSFQAVIEGAMYTGSLKIADNVISLDANLDGDTIAAEVVFSDTAIEGWAEVDGERLEGSLTFDPNGECSTLMYTGDGESEQGCLEEFLPVGQSEMLAGMLSDVSDLSLPSPTIVSTEYDGQWYVSPLLTMSNVILTYLRSTDADAVRAQFDQFDEFLGSDF